MRQGADIARPNSSGIGEIRMELMMSHLHAGPALAARGVDAAEVTFLVRGSVSAAAGPGGLTEIQPFETTDLDASEGAH
jgi:hypothetical protein